VRYRPLAPLDGQDLSGAPGGDDLGPASTGGQHPGQQPGVGDVDALPEERGAQVRAAHRVGEDRCRDGARPALARIRGGQQAQHRGGQVLARRHGHPGTPVDGEHAVHRVPGRQCPHLTAAADPQLQTIGAPGQQVQQGDQVGARETAPARLVADLVLDPAPLPDRAAGGVEVQYNGCRAEPEVLPGDVELGGRQLDGTRIGHGRPPR